jgi:hypothetical protein
MTNFIEIEENKPTTTTKYYRYVEVNPPAPTDFYGMELYATEYKSFLVARESHEYLLWSIKTIGNGLSPLKLRGKFTTAERAWLAIDGFLMKEEEAQRASADA